MLKQFLKSNMITLDIETTSESGKKEDNVNPWKNEIICLAMYDGENEISLTYEQMLDNKDDIIKIITIKTQSSITSNILWNIKPSELAAIFIEKFLRLFNRIKQYPISLNGPTRLFPCSFDHCASMVLINIIIFGV